MIEIKTKHVQQNRQKGEANFFCDTHNTIVFSNIKSSALLSSYSIYFAYRNYNQNIK